MGISNDRSWYVNPNTRQVTSNIRNTAIKDREAFNGSMQNLLNPVEDLAQVLRTPIRLADRSSLNRQRNAVNIASGMRIAVNDGYLLTVKPQGVEVSGGDNPYDTEAYLKAQKMAGSLATLLRNACGNMNTVAYSQEEYARWNEGVSDLMGYLGIDTSKDFTVNGMKYSKNENGWYESQANSEAKAAYEMLKANNRTYTFANEKTFYTALLNNLVSELQRKSITEEKAMSEAAGQESETKTEMIVKPDGSRVLVMTMSVGGMETTMSLEISKPTKTLNENSRQGADHNMPTADNDAVPDEVPDISTKA